MIQRGFQVLRVRSLSNDSAIGFQSFQYSLAPDRDLKPAASLLEWV